MRKQYCMEWNTKSGKLGWKSLGHDLAEKELCSILNKKIRQKSTTSAYITWNYTGNDVPDEEIGEDHFLFGLCKTCLNLMGMNVYFDNDIHEMEQ